MLRLRTLALTLVVVAGTVAAQVAAQADPRFDRDVRPILAAKCFACHGPDAARRKKDLRLDVRAAALEAGAFVPGDADGSELVRRIEHADVDERMPPKSSGHVLTQTERATLRAWIAAGAEYEPHWSFSPPQRPELPECKDDAFVRNPIDAFVLDAMRRHGLGPAPEAAPQTLARRLSLDVLGLPPTPEKVAAFVADPARDAYARFVDGLFASPHHGEHLALPWLDLARYADSNGYQADGDRQAWPWRDWLVQALNANRPLDEMVVEMLAGDLLPHPTQAQRVATAFQRHHAINNEGGAIPEEVRFQYVVDRVNTFATGFLGLTVACAQCHDHKYDPISQREYYALFAFFDNVDEDGRLAVTRRNTYHEFQIAKPYLELADPDQAAALAGARAEAKVAGEAHRAVEGALAKAQGAWVEAIDDAALARLPGDVAAAVRKLRGTPLTGPEHRRLRGYFATQVTDNAAWSAAQRRLEAADVALAVLHEHVPVVMVMGERGERRPTHLHARGAYDQPTGEPIAPDAPAALGALAEDAPRDRLGLARWLVAPTNPLFARVFVNRLWQGVFGRGLVATPEDFGATGERPTHPELLDWLAVELIESGFDIRHVLRLIVTSATYRQSAASPEEQRARDPEAIWLSRSPRPRLSSFALRDQALALGGLLDGRVGGPPAYAYHPDGLWRDVSFDVFAYPHGRAGEQHRRSLYTFWRRTVAPPALFDAANRQTCVVRPPRTNTPLHALVLLNETTHVEAARALAVRATNAATSRDDRLAHLFTLATLRAPDAAELEVLRRALAREQRRFATDPAAAAALLAVGVSRLPTTLPESEIAAWTNLAQLVLNLDEVLCRP